jgi:hypothetical protein
MNRLIDSPEEFIASRDAGGFHPDTTYDGYLEMIRAQAALVEQAKADAEARGFTLNPVEPDLSLEEVAELEKIWEEIRAENRAEREAPSLAQAA